MTAGEQRAVFIDARWTRFEVPDGITRYGANLIEALHRVHPVTMLIHDRRQLRWLPNGVPYVLVNSPFSAHELILSRTLHRLGAEVVFSPMQVIGGFRRRYKLILTLHDLIYYRYPRPPSFLPLPVRLIWRLFHKVYWPQRILLNRADAVVTVSETTKILINQFQLTKRPVHVVHNAPSTQWERPANSDDARDLVYMGAFLPYKNVETLIAGMSMLPEYRLHLLSPINPTREAELSALVPADADVVFWRGIAEADYQRLLAGAAAAVTASLDEGFGLPVIEAMNVATPVVCADLAVLREITDGHAMFFDPNRPSEFAAGVRALAEPGRRAALVAAASRRARDFTWQDAAERLLTVIRSV